MSEAFQLRELYQEVIIDHNKNPRHFYILDKHTHHAEGFNPLCGDKLDLYLIVDANNIIKDIGFQGSGCAISTASASLMTEALIGKTFSQAHELFECFHCLMTQDPADKPFFNGDGILGKLTVLKGVQAFPSRVKCATLAWHTLNAALAQQKKPVSTE